MIFVSGIAGAISLVVGWVITLRLFSLARRTGRAPEKTLAIAFAGIYCGGYPMAAASRAPGMVGTVEGSLLFTIGMLGIGVGIAALSRFPQLVFRPGRPWAVSVRNLVAAGGLVSATACAVTIARAHSREEMIATIQPWSIVLVVSIAIPFLWNALESTLYYRRMRMRLALELTDPITTHRFLAWAIAGWVVVAQLLTLIILRASGVALLTPLPMTIIAGSSLAATICCWLTFFMPEIYKKKVLGLDVNEASPDPEQTS